MARFLSNVLCLTETMTTFSCFTPIFTGSLYCPKFLLLTLSDIWIHSKVLAIAL